MHTYAFVLPSNLTNDDDDDDDEDKMPLASYIPRIEQ